LLSFFGATFAFAGFSADAGVPFELGFRFSGCAFPGPAFSFPTGDSFLLTTMS